MGEIIAGVIIALIIGGAVAYVIKAKRSGRKCIGCPDSRNCHAKNKGNHKCGGGGCSCH